jgi:hypothetical protein
MDCKMMFLLFVLFSNFFQDHLKPKINEFLRFNQMSAVASKNRSLLQVAPPQRRAIRRNRAQVAPLRQVVLLSKRSVVPDDIITYSNQKRDRNGAPTYGDVMCAFVMVWPDTTIRELLEAVMQQNPDQSREWLLGADEDKMKVKVCHVFPGPDRKPSVDSFATLKLNGPTEAKDDLVTFSELSERKCAFKAGDLIVFSRVETPASATH